MSATSTPARWARWQITEPLRLIRMSSRELLSPRPLTSQELMAALWESRLVPGEELRRLSAECGSAPEDGFGLGQEAMRRGLLTPFQLEQLLAGNGEHLVLGGY